MDTHLQDGNPEPQGVGILAPIVGVLLCALVAFLGVRSYVLFDRYSGFADHFNTVGVIFLLFWVTLAVLGLKWLGLGTLSPQGLSLVYAMMMIATVLPTMGFGGYFLPIVAGARYYASPDNQWAQNILPHLPTWISPQDPEVVRQLFEGMPRGGRIPWELWIMPLVIWSSFMLAFFFVSVGLVSLVHYQWDENERLRFPLAVVPLVLTGSVAGPARNILRSRLLWVGFAAAAAIPLWNFVVGYYQVPGLTPLRLSTSVFIPGLEAGFLLRLDLLVVGLSYLVDVDVLLSVCAFHWLAVVQNALMVRFGVEQGIGGQVCAAGGVLMANQQTGALIFFVAFSMWLARHYLWGMVRMAWHNNWDGRGVVSPRACLVMVAVGLAYMIAFVHVTGLRLTWTLVFMLLALCMFVGTTRLLAQTGVSRMRAAYSPASMMAGLVGTQAFSSSEIGALGLTFVWASDIQLFVMGTASHALKVCQERRVRGRTVLLLMTLAMVVGLIVVCYSYISLGHHYGLINGFGWYYHRSVLYHWGWVNGAMVSPTAAEPRAWGFLGLGGALAGLLTLAYYRIPGWPLHPVGLAISMINTVAIDWAGIFLCLVIKYNVIRYGGPKLYRLLLPLFLGLILGTCVGIGLGAFVSSLELMSLDWLWQALGLGAAP